MVLSYSVNDSPLSDLYLLLPTPPAVSFPILIHNGLEKRTIKSNFVNLLPPCLQTLKGLDVQHRVALMLMRLIILYEVGGWMYFP